MAESDYTVADRVVLDADGNPVDEGHLTAQQKVEQTVQATPDADAAAFAASNDVSRPEYANYATALETLQAREDIETLASRRARTYGADFNDADYMREVPGQPGSGSIYGQAPKQHGEAADDGSGEDVYGTDGTVGEPDPTP